jgi:hypothetical protein
MAAAVPSVIGGPGWDFASDLTHRQRFVMLHRRKRTRRSRALLLLGVYRRQGRDGCRSIPGKGTLPELGAGLHRTP